jgi:hypothetical protein
MEISRSEICTIDECEEKAYAEFREDGTGHVPAGASSNLTTLQGIALHKAGELIFNEGLNSNWAEAISTVFSSLEEPFRTIKTTLIRRAMLGWTLERYPTITSEWQPLGAEIPFKWEFAPGFTQPLRLDDIMEHRSHGGLAIFDFKTAGSPDLNWTKRKANSKQTHLYLKALKSVAPERHISGMMYDCIEIGKWDNKKNVQKSPFVMGYKNKSGKISPKHAYGSTIVDLCSYSDDAWLKWALETNALDGLYWTTGLINPNDAQLDRTAEATATQAMDWAIKLKKVENSIDPRAEANKQFARNPEACLQFGWEYACPFYKRCWENQKLDAETFEPRRNHHA